MWRVFGIVLLLTGLGAALSGGLELMGQTPLAWLANLGGLLLFVVATELLFSPAGWQALSGLITADLGRKQGALLLAGASLGFIAAGFARLNPDVLFPIYVFAGLFAVLSVCEWLLVRWPRWRTFREIMAQDVRAKVGLVFVAGVIDLIIVSLLQRHWDYFLPVAGLLVMGALLSLTDRVFGRSRLWAVARHMVAESIRTKVALLFIVVIVLLLGAGPFIVVGDGVTLKSRVQSFLGYSLGATGFLLSVLTVFLACGAIVSEVRLRHVYMVTTKPLPRWQFFVGKWVGIGALNAILLTVAGMTVIAGTRYLSRQPTLVPGDRAALVHEVLNVRHAFPIQQPDWERLVEARVRTLQEQGRWDELDPAAQTMRRQSVLKELQAEWKRLPPGVVREYEFRNLLVEREGAHYVHLRFKPMHPTGLDEVPFPIIIQAGDPSDLNTMTPERPGKYVPGRFHEIEIPTWAVNKEDTLYVRMVNLHPRDPLRFEGDDGVQLLYGLGTFHWNLGRALAMVWCRLAFLTAAGLLLSTFLSFPVACMGCFLVLAASTGAGWLGDAIRWTAPAPTDDDPLWLFGPALRRIARGFIFLVPDFSEHDPVENVVAGRLVPLMWVSRSIVLLVFIKSLILTIVGCVVFWRRELAQVTV